MSSSIFPSSLNGSIGSTSSSYLFSSTPDTSTVTSVSSSSLFDAGATFTGSSGKDHSCLFGAAFGLTPANSTTTTTTSSWPLTAGATVTGTSSSSISATVPTSCSPELQEVTAVFASQCDKFLSCRAARQAQGRGETKSHVSFAQPWVFGSVAPQATSKPVSDSAHTSTATAEKKHGESEPCNVPMTCALSTNTASAPLESNLGSLVLPSLQPAEEEQSHFPPVDLLHSTLKMWERVVANKKTDQEVTEEGLRHFYEGINYFCLQYDRLQEATAKYNDVAKVSEDLENMMAPLKDKLAETCKKLKDSEIEKGRLERDLSGVSNVITALTDDKESLLRVQTLLHQKIFELKRELEEAGPIAIQKYRASSLYKQELMEYAASYLGKGVKLAIEKIKAKDPSFDPKTYGLELYMLPPEADDEELSSEKESDGGGIDQEHNEVKPSAGAQDLADQHVTSNNIEPTVLGLSAEEARYPLRSA